MSRLKYVPSPAPQSDEPRELVRYLMNELQELAVSFEKATTRASGVLYLDSVPSSPIAVGVTDQLINDYDSKTLEDEIISDIAAGTFTTEFDGEYNIHFSTSVQADANNRTLTFSIYIDGAFIAPLETPIFLKTANEPLVASIDVPVKLTKGVVIDVRVKSNIATNIVYNKLVFNVQGQLEL